MKKAFQLITVFTLILLVSCTKRIDIDLNTLDNQRLVVEGWVTNKLQQHEIKLSITSSYFESGSNPKATNAVVQISDGSNTWILTEEDQGIYRTPEFAGEFGKTYSLNIIWDNEEYTAESLLREVAPITDVEFEYFDPLEEYGFEENPWFNVKIWTQELEGIGDSYFWPVSINGVEIRNDLSDITFSDDEFYDGSEINGIAVEEIEYGYEGVEGDTVYIEQWNIGKEAYEIFEAILLETDWRGSIFDTPPANVPSNISNGALGYFGAAGVSSFEGIIPE